MRKFQKWACFHDDDDDGGCDTSTAEEQGNDIPDSPSGYGVAE